jgi:hypothetical protein
MVNVAVCRIPYRQQLHEFFQTTAESGFSEEMRMRGIIVAVARSRHSYT